MTFVVARAIPRSAVLLTPYERVMTLLGALPMAASMTEAEQERVVERLQATLGGT